MSDMVLGGEDGKAIIECGVSLKEMDILIAESDDSKKNAATQDLFHAEYEDDGC